MSGRSALVRIALDYLAAAEERDLERASSFLLVSAEIIFPGGVHHHDLAEVVAAARRRYRWVKKSIDHVDADDDHGVVVVVGRLRGENLHAVPFASVRFIDRFTFSGSHIQTQHVWNDLAESGVLHCTQEADVPEAFRWTD